MAFFGLFGKKTAAPVVAQKADGGSSNGGSFTGTSDATPAPSTVSVATLTGKALLVSLAGLLAQQIVQYGIDATPLAVLPIPLKLGVSIVAPMVAAWLAKSPLSK